MGKRNWDRIRLDYVTGEITLKALAERERVAVSVINGRSQKECWIEQKESYRRRIVAESQRIIASEEIDARILAARLANAMTKKYLEHIERAETPAPISQEVMDSLRQLAVLQGYATKRDEHVMKDWRDIAKGLGLEPEEVLAEFERVAAGAEPNLDSDRGADGTATAEEMAEVD